METPSRHSFDCDGTTRVFPIPSPIKGDNYCRLEVDGTIINDRTKYDIVNNSIVFIDAADVPNGSQLDVLVVQSEEAIGQLTITTNIDIVATNIADINTVATNVADVNTLADIELDIQTLADIEDGTDSTDAIQTVAGISANVTTVAGNNTNVTTVAGSIASVNTVAASDTAVNTVSTNIASVNTVATNINDVITVANDLNEAISEIEVAALDLQEVTSEIDTVANSIANVDAVGTNITNVNTVAGISGNVTTVAGISSDVTTVSGISANVTTVANDGTDIGVVAGLSTDIQTLADIEDGTTALDAISGVAAIASNVTSVAGNATNINAVAGNATNINTVAGDTTAINTVAGDTTAINAVATNSANINTVATDIAQIITTANDLNEAVSEIETVANAITNVDLVGNNITNVNSVAGSITNVNTVASNLTDINAFADTYYISATAPTSPTEGDLWFDTANDTMKVYNGSTWQNAGSSVNGTEDRFKYVATSGQTVFSGTDAYGGTLAYDAGYIDVYLNGVHLDPSDYTATDGTTITLASGAALNDELYIVAFGTFVLADHYDKTQSDARYATSAQGSNADTAYGWGDHSTQNYAVTTGDTMTGALNFGDNVKAQFGASNDLQIYHSGTSSFIDDAGTGDLILRSSSIQLQKYTGETMAGFVADGAVTLRYDHSQKFATTSTGVSVTGKAVGTLTTDNDLSFDMNASNQFKCTPTSTGSLTFTNITAGQSGNIWLDNSAAVVITAATTTYISAADLAAINSAGKYFLSYYSDGTNVMVSASAAVTSQGV